MTTMLRTFAGAGGFVLLSVLLAGCHSGPAKVDVTGKVTNKGELLKVGKQGVIQVIFYLYPDVKEGNPVTGHPAKVNKETGTFDIKGLPVGKYLIAVEQFDPYPRTDLLEGAFDRKNSPIVRDVTGQEPIDIDLAKEAPAK
jgi:hypothetical protein